jgi:putative endonuclease
MPCIYILYSPSTDIYYTGSTTITAESRLQRHLAKYYKNKFTGKISDWELFYEIECESIKQALQIETHIKKMKSKKYVTDLKQYPEISIKLKIKYVAS